MSHSEKKIAWAFYNVVRQFERDSAERDALLDVAYTLAPLEDVEAFMLACGFVHRDG